MRILNNDAGDGDDMSVSQHLNKTAKKQEDAVFDSLLAERRHHEKIDKNIEALLEDDDDYGHISDDDLKHFTSELGLDSYLDHDNNLEF
jgi:cytochrome P450